MLSSIVLMYHGSSAAALTGLTGCDRSVPETASSKHST